MPTKKISEVFDYAYTLLKKPICRDPEHNPPSMMYFENGIWEHTCPKCGETQRFIVSRPIYEITI